VLLSIFDAYARIVALGGARARAARVAELRREFEERTGPFAAEDAWFDTRSRAFWDDALTRGRFGREVEGELEDEERGWLDAFERAHRGLFAAHETDGARVLEDVWSGAAFVATAVDEVSRSELAAAEGQLIDARLVGTREPAGVALLPGAVFHPRDATDAIDRVLEAARARALATDAVLDALLRMEQRLRALSRVKAAYAYRPESLG
jgi:hypothetical protein